MKKLTIIAMLLLIPAALQAIEPIIGYDQFHLGDTKAVVLQACGKTQADIGMDPQTGTEALVLHDPSGNLIRMQFTCEGLLFTIFVADMKATLKDHDDLMAHLTQKHGYPSKALSGGQIWSLGDRSIQVDIKFGDAMTVFYHDLGLMKRCEQPERFKKY